MKRVLFAWVIVALVLIGIPAFAECRHIFRQQVVHHAHVQPIVHQNIFYSVGEGLVQQVKIEQEVQRQVKLALQQQAPQQQTAVTGTTLQAKCAKCHSGEGAKGGFDLSQGVTDAEFRRIVELIGEGIDVPAAMKGVIGSLSAQDKGNITSEMLKLRPQPAARIEPQVTIPPPEQSGVLR
jgi:uncharacterized membrane protein